MEYKDILINSIDFMVISDYNKLIEINFVDIKNIEPPKECSWVERIDQHEENAIVRAIRKCIDVIIERIEIDNILFAKSRSFKISIDVDNQSHEYVVRVSIMLYNKISEIE